MYQPEPVVVLVIPKRRIGCLIIVRERCLLQRQKQEHGKYY